MEHLQRIMGNLHALRVPHKSPNMMNIHTQYIYLIEGYIFTYLTSIYKILFNICNKFLLTINAHNCKHLFHGGTCSHNFWLFILAAFDCPYSVDHN